MKKIMFNDRFGLTEAVLSGGKTQTRRLVPEKYYKHIEALGKPVLMIPVECIPVGVSIEEFKDQFIKNWPKPGLITVRNAEKISVLDPLCEMANKISPYKVGEEVAIAQKYWDLRECNAFYEALQKADPTFPLECIKGEKGCDNKMFVKADWMPHHIRITGIKVERLQNISEKDTMREGIMEGEFMNTWDRYYYDSWGDVPNHITFPTPIRAFAHLIDKVSGAGTWNSNPWVFVYDFELVK